MIDFFFTIINYQHPVMSELGTDIFGILLIFQSRKRGADSDHRITDFIKHTAFFWSLSMVLR